MQSLRAVDIRGATASRTIYCGPGGREQGLSEGTDHLGAAPLEDSATKAKNPCRTRLDGTVEIFDALMEAGRPSPFQVDGWWFVAVKPPGAGRDGVYYVQDNAEG